MKLIKRLKRKKGFTLTECLISILIFALMASIVMQILAIAIAQYRSNDSIDKDMDTQISDLVQENALVERETTNLVMKFVSGTGGTNNITINDMKIKNGSSESVDGALQINKIDATIKNNGGNSNKDKNSGGMVTDDIHIYGTKNIDSVYVAENSAVLNGDVYSMRIDFKVSTNDSVLNGSESKSLKKQITQSEQLLRSTKKDVKSQLNNLALLSGQIDDQRRYVAGIEAEVKQLDSNIVHLSSQVKKLVAELNECKRKYGRSVVYMYKNRSTQNKLMFLFSAKNFSQMFRRMRYMMEYAKYQRAQGEIIREKETAVRNKQNELLSTKAQKTQLLAAGRTEQAKLEGQQKEREGIVSELKKRQSKLQSTIAQTRKRYNSLNAKIDRLIQQEIEAAERRRREEEARRRREAERKAKAEAAARAKKMIAHGQKHGGTRNEPYA